MRYYIIAGEASGDLHGSNLIKGLVSEDPEARFRLWGGDLMAGASRQAAETMLVHHYRDTAVMGFTDVIAKAGQIAGNLRGCKDDILEWQPDVVVLIDYPGFNMKIAKFCHEHSIKVFYYIAPKTWASRENRNRKLKKWVDRLFIVFPFEIPYFSSRGIPFEYAGNPLLDAVDGHEYAPVSKEPYIALLAGSRKGEINRMMPVCMQVADELGCKVIIAGAPSRTEADYLPFINGRKNVELVFDRTYDIIRYADAAIINSGTASLEAALIGTPQVVCWSTSPITAFLARKVFHVLDNVRFISLGNLIIDRPAFRELIQEDFTVKNVKDEVSRLSTDMDYRSKMTSDYIDIRKALGGAGASQAVARAMISNLH